MLILNDTDGDLGCVSCGCVLYPRSEIDRSREAVIFDMENPRTRQPPRRRV